MREFPKLPKISDLNFRRPRMIAGLIAALVVVGGLTVRLVENYNLRNSKADDLIPTVSVVRPTGASAENQITLPGSVEAWSQAPVYARTNGYLKAWYADIGAQVKAGQLLAEIDTPDVSQQLAAASANLLTAQAQLRLAESTARRWEKLLAQNAVSQQDMEDKRNDLAVRRTMASAALAEVNRLQTMQEFRRIVAPFDGTVTSRATDVGALIVSGNSAARPLFTVADISKMRIYVNVPQNYMADIKPGMKASLAMPQYTDRAFPLALSNTADAINRTSGTMLVQFTAENADRALKPGSYAQVSIVLPRAKTVRIPASALLFRPEGMMVVTVDNNGIVKIKPVKIARDFGAEVEIQSGLLASDIVVDSPPDALVDGDQVHMLQSKAS